MANRNNRCENTTHRDEDRCRETFPSQGVQIVQMSYVISPSRPAMRDPKISVQGFWTNFLPEELVERREKLESRLTWKLTTKNRKRKVMMK